MAGSSPRVRGAEWNGLNVTVTFGIIPARAGSSSPCCAPTASSRDHPRACGEQLFLPLTYQGPAGSSPRVRGAGSALNLTENRLGIIPARAGSSLRATTAIPWRRDHPRACGEQPPCKSSSSQAPGSSPRVRGAGTSTNGGHVLAGIIPARAGSSCLCRRHHTRRRDHPRACGEQLRALNKQLYSQGSSPRVRGAAAQTARTCPALGIIPARAGSSLLFFWSHYALRDHPRACGEQFSIRVNAPAQSGSSPRVRGAAQPAWISPWRLGIIPARAGSRLKNPSSKHPIPLMWAPF